MAQQYATDVLPASADAYDLGSQAQEWRNVYAQALYVASYILGSPSFKWLSAIRFADQFTGTTVTAKIDAALADSGCKVVVIPSTMAAGNATSIAAGQCLIDFRSGPPKIFTNASVGTPAVSIADNGQVTFNDGVVAALTGNVTGNLTGNVTGNVTGAVTGTASGNKPTIVEKYGTGAGDYTYSTNTSYADVDSTNLSYTVTVPVGSTLTVTAVGAITTYTGAVLFGVALNVDGSLVRPEIVATPGAAAAYVPFALAHTIAGDGASHTIKLQYQTSNNTDAVHILNQSATQVPVMVFTLVVAN